MSGRPPKLLPQQLGGMSLSSWAPVLAIHKSRRYKSTDLLGDMIDEDDEAEVAACWPVNSLDGCSQLRATQACGYMLLVFQVETAH